MIAFLLSPVGRWIAIFWLVVVAVCTAYVVGHNRGEKHEAAAAARDALRRANNAIDAGNGLDLSPGRLREPDGNRRD